MWGWVILSQPGGEIAEDLALFRTFLAPRRSVVKQPKGKGRAPVGRGSTMGIGAVRRISSLPDGNLTGQRLEIGEKPSSNALSL